MADDQAPIPTGVDSLPMDVIDHVLLRCLSIGQLARFASTSRAHRASAYDVRKATQWERALPFLSASNRFAEAVEEAREGDSEWARDRVGDHARADPRLSAAYAELDARQRFQALAAFCRTTVGGGPAQRADGRSRNRGVMDVHLE